MFDQDFINDGYADNLNNRPRNKHVFTHFKKLDCGHFHVIETTDRDMVDCYACNKLLKDIPACRVCNDAPNFVRDEVTPTTEYTCKGCSRRIVVRSDEYNLTK